MPRRRLNFRGAVKLQNGALNANEILERRWGEAKLREGGPWAPFHVLALPRRCLFCLPAFLPLPRVDLIILPTARPLSPFFNPTAAASQSIRRHC